MSFNEGRFVTAPALSKRRSLASMADLQSTKLQCPSLLTLWTTGISSKTKGLFFLGNAGIGSRDGLIIHSRRHRFIFENEFHTMSLAHGETGGRFEQLF